MTTTVVLTIFACSIMVIAVDAWLVVHSRHDREDEHMERRRRNCTRR